MVDQNDELTPLGWLIVMWFAFWFIGPAFIESEYAGHSYGAVFPVLFKGAIHAHYLEIRPHDEEGFTWFSAIFIQCVMIVTIFGGAMFACGLGGITVKLCDKIGI